MFSILDLREQSLEVGGGRRWDVFRRKILSIILMTLEALLP